MPERDNAWLRYQQKRWQRPDAYLWVRPDAARFFLPGTDPAEVFPAPAVKYSPYQPRVPAGHPDGGQWTGGAGGLAESRDPRQSASIAQPMGNVDIGDARSIGRDLGLFRITPSTPDATGVRLAGDLPEGSGPGTESATNKPPDIPQQMPETRDERMGFVRTAARWIARVGPFAPAVDAFFGALDQVDEINRLTDMIRTANDPSGTLEELRMRAGTPSERGYHDHHIVGQHEQNRMQFGDGMIESRDNVVRIPEVKHLDINGWYSRASDEFGGRSPRDYLRGKNWDEQMRVGLRVLREFGVLK